MKSRWTVACIALALTAFAGQGTASAAFHTAEGKAGNSLSGSTNNVIISFLGLYMSCEASSLLGVTTGGAPDTQDLAPSFGNCFAWGNWTVNTKGCKFRFDQFEDATLHGCNNGGIELTMGAPLNTCAVFVPNQTVPASYENGPEKSYLEIGFESAAFTGKLTQAIGQCPLPKEEKDITVYLSGKFKVTSVGGFWFDSAGAEFHAASSAAIAGTPVEGISTFEVDGETIKCNIGSLAGSFPGSASAETLGALAASPATGSCKSEDWGGKITVDASGCKYVLHADGAADLESCSKGGVVINQNVPFVYNCTILIPNQSGASTATYRNHRVNGASGVRATLDLALSGKATEYKGIYCRHSVGEEVSVSQESVTDFFANEGATGLRFG